MKTEALKQALDKYGFDAAFGGARRDEEISRAKERIFSFRREDMFGTRAISVRNSGIYSIRASMPANQFACFHCRIGLRSTYWRYIGAKIFALFRCTSPCGRWYGGAALGSW